MFLNRLAIRHDALGRFDPRARLAAAFLLIIAAVNIREHALLLALTVISAFFLRRDIVCVLKRLLPFLSFAALFLAQSFFGLIKIELALLLMLRMISAALIFMLFAAPLGAGRLLAALGALKLNQKLLCILYLSLRYIYMMSDTVYCSIRAMKLRKNPEYKSAIFVWKSYAAVFASALAAAFFKADKIGAALSCRGFDGIIPKTEIFFWRVRDTFLAVFAALVLTLYLFYSLYEALI